jgi:Fur family ferric uptake transcriptional regulator
MSDRGVGLRERFTLYIRENGLKQTRQRAAIFEAFLTSEHVSVDELLLAVQVQQPGVGYATVYRALKLFVQAGVADKSSFGDGQARFEPVDLHDEHHDHLICTECGKIFEFEDEVIERRQEAVAEKLGLKLKSHKMTLWGECLDIAACQAD